MFGFSLLATETATVSGTADSAWWAAIGALIVTVLGAAGSLYSILRKESRTDDGEVKKEYKAIITRLEKQIARQHELINGYDDAITEAREEHTQCRVQLVEMWGWLNRFRDWMVRQSEICRHIGHDPGQIPDMPPPPVEARHPTARTEFNRRTVEQGAELIKEVDKRMMTDGDKLKRPSESEHENPRGG